MSPDYYEHCSVHYYEHYSVDHYEQKLASLDERAHGRIALILLFNTEQILFNSKFRSHTITDNNMQNSYKLIYILNGIFAFYELQLNISSTIIN